MLRSIKGSLKVGVILLLFLAIAGFLFVPAVKANGIPYFPEPLPVNSGYIRSDGAIDPPTLTIQREENVYALTADIVNCTLIIERNDTVLNGNDHSIVIPSYGERDEKGATKGVSSLIRFSNLSNIMIENFSLQNCRSGISFLYSSNVTIFSNKISGFEVGAIYLQYCNSCNITGNILQKNLYGISGYKNNYIDITHNQISASGSHGIVIEDSTLNIVRNAFIGNGQCAICYLQSSSRVVGNVFQNNEQGILSYSSGFEIHHNNFINNRICDVAIKAPNILDDGDEGNYWSKHPNNSPYRFASIFIHDNETNIDNHPQQTPYSFDSQQPTVGVVLSENKIQFNGSVILGLTYSKYVTKISYSLDGQARIECANGTVLNGLTGGHHTLKVYAEDIYGNEAVTEATFDVDNPIDYSVNYYPLTLAAVVAALVLILVSVLLYWQAKKQGFLSHSKNRMCFKE